MNKLSIFWILITAMTLVGCDSSDHHQEGESHHDGHGTHDDGASEYERGPNNGRMLRDGDFAIELAIFETGVPPEFRAWPTRNGEPVPVESVNLNVQLIRLGGQDDINFESSGSLLRGDTVIYEPHSFAVEVTARYNNKTYTWAYDSFEGRTLIEPGVARAFGLETETAGPATIRQHLLVFGRITADPDREVSIAARYEGQVQSVSVSTGDSVREDQSLISVQSDESLQTYTIQSPLDGTVIHRAVSAGEQTRGQELLRIVNHDVIWAMLDIFPADLARVDVGKRVQLMDSDSNLITEGKIDWLSPQSNPDQSVSARVVIANDDGALRPGQRVQAHVEVASFDVPLAVRRSGLQSFRDFSVVYGKFGDEYEVRMLDLGREGREYIEVLDGIEPGIPYVTMNSYLVKADIEKSGASHDH